MKNGFQAHGPIEFARGKESNAWKSIKEKYVDELASASLFQKLKIKFRMLTEFFRRGKEGHKPSAKTLW